MKTADLRRLVASLDNGVWGEEPDGDGTEIRCVRAADFDFARLRATVDTAPFRKIAPAQRRRLSLGRGDLILEKSGGGEKQVVGRAVLYDRDVPAVCSNFAARLRPTPSVAPRYLAYLLAALYFDGATARCVLQTTGIQNLDTDAWLQTEVPVLELDEQRRIADFLDDQVARIDNIIAARRSQIELINSQRVCELDSLINDDERPAARLALFAQIQSGITVDAGRESVDGIDVPYLRVANVQAGALNLDEVKSIRVARSQVSRYLLRDGDVLMTEGGDIDKLGRGTVAFSSARRDPPEPRLRRSRRPVTPDPGVPGIRDSQQPGTATTSS